MEHAQIDTAAATLARPEMRCEGADLHRAAAFLAKRVVNEKAVPVLQCVKIEPVEGGARLVATDTLTPAAITIPARWDVPGPIVVNAAALATLTKKLGKHSVALEQREAPANWKGQRGTDSIVVRAGRTAFNLQAYDPDQFPLWRDDTRTMTVAEVVQWENDYKAACAAQRAAKPVTLSADIVLIGEDGTERPIATSNGKITLSADEVRALCGDDLFATVAFAMPDGSTAYVLQWQLDEGWQALRTVPADGKLSGKVSMVGGILRGATVRHDVTREYVLASMDAVRGYFVFEQCDDGSERGHSWHRDYETAKRAHEAIEPTKSRNAPWPHCWRYMIVSESHAGDRPELIARDRAFFADIGMQPKPATGGEAIEPEAATVKPASEMRQCRNLWYQIERGSFGSSIFYNPRNPDPAGHCLPGILIADPAHGRGDADIDAIIADHAGQIVANSIAAGEALARAMQEAVLPAQPAPKPVESATVPPAPDLPAGDAVAANEGQGDDDATAALLDRIARLEALLAEQASNVPDETESESAANIATDDDDGPGLWATALSADSIPPSIGGQNARASRAVRGRLVAAYLRMRAGRAERNLAYRAEREIADKAMENEQAAKAERDAAKRNNQYHYDYGIVMQGKLRAMAAKRRRAVLKARDLQQRLYAEHKLVDRYVGKLRTAECERDNARARIATLESRPHHLGNEVRPDDVARLTAERDSARQRAERAEQARDAVAGGVDRIEAAMDALLRRALAAETANRALEARLARGGVAPGLAAAA